LFSHHKIKIKPYTISFIDKISPDEVQDGESVSGASWEQMVLGFHKDLSELPWDQLVFQQLRAD
jgi:hypothetical protein